MKENSNNRLMIGVQSHYFSSSSLQICKTQVQSEVKLQLVYKFKNVLLYYRFALLLLTLHYIINLRLKRFNINLYNVYAPHSIRFENQWKIVFFDSRNRKQAFLKFLYQSISCKDFPDLIGYLYPAFLISLIYPFSTL